ncbi:MAG: 50S ribosomal protein L17 [Kiritimatiellaeota bacterium]|nr:50S ribosomal protein L17 [Kiritimatiellota bacterium]
MRHRKHTFKIGRTASHRRALLANLACSLIREGRVVTTVAKAKEARRLAEKMITLARKGTLHGRRRAIAILHHVSTVHRLFEEIGPEYKNRNGGYTRIVRTGPRRGDAAEMCILELVGPLAIASEASSETNETQADNTEKAQTNTATAPEEKSGP